MNRFGNRGIAALLLLFLGTLLIAGTIWSVTLFPLTVLYIGSAFWAASALILVLPMTMARSHDHDLPEHLAELPAVATPPPKTLPDQELQKKADIAAQRQNELPGHAAGGFQLLDEKIALAVTPRADPMTPMYLLDKHFRVIDWNTAFSLCFDRTLEGRVGHSILEWTYFLDNYEDVLEHGIEKFGEGKIQPDFDIEAVHYTSQRYGKIAGIKRAYPIPDDQGQRAGWLITIKPSFQSRDKAGEYQNDLFASIRSQLMWSEYALSYDTVLLNSDVYPQLIATLLGRRQPGPPPLRDASAILDLGAGTGNITQLLAAPERHNRIVAVENNSVMAGILRQKCDQFLTTDPRHPGIMVVKQDASSLFGLDDGYFDYAIDNNFLYSLNADAVTQCLKEVLRVLKPGGELRISEPHRHANVSKVLQSIKDDLQRKGHFTRLQGEYQKVRIINEFQLAPLLQKWTLDDMKKLLLDTVGFQDVTFASGDVYVGQSMLLCARKAA